MAPNDPWLSYAGDTSSWLQPEVAQAIRDELPALADEIVRAIQAQVPQYSGPLRGDFGRGIRLGTEQALRRFMGEGDAEGPAVYRALGYGEHRAGRSLDSLQSAYRIGARLAWRRLSGVAAAAGASVDVQHRLAEAMFAYIDQLASESVDGYARAQLARAGDLGRSRELLLSLLLASPPAHAEELAAASAAARWPLPATLAGVALSGDPGPLARRLSGDALHGTRAGLGALIVPDPVRLVAEAEAAAERLGLRIGLGPQVAPGQARRSLYWAQLAARLPGSPAAVPAEEHLADLVLGAAPEVVEALRERALEPLERESPRSRERLTATLRSWLRQRGSQRAVAEELGVHAQTVRYRVARLRELFGERLEDPERRFELEIALRD